MPNKISILFAIIFASVVGLIYTIPSYANVPKGHDFTVVQIDANYAPGELLVRFAPKANGKQRTLAERNAVLAADANGYAYAWGRNTEGQLGIGSF